MLLSTGAECRVTSTNRTSIAYRTGHRLNKAGTIIYLVQNGLDAALLCPQWSRENRHAAILTRKRPTRDRISQERVCVSYFICDVSQAIDIHSRVGKAVRDT